MITETIRVMAEGQRIKHGIYRDIPLQYTDQWGNTYDDVLNIKKVLKDGLIDDYSLEGLNNGQRLYIGEKNLLLVPGEYTYTIVYDINRHIQSLKDQDKLSWNVTGDNWNFDIDKVIATVELPEGALGKSVSAQAYIGSEGKDFFISKDPMGRVVFETVRPLHSSEGFTVVILWPKGFIKESHLPDDHSGLITAIGSVLLLLFYYIIVWLLVGRDPKRGAIASRFNPPDGISPAMARYLMKMNFDDKVFTVATYNMAVKGSLKIEEEIKRPPLSNIYTLTRINDSINLSVEEAALEKELFKEGRRVDLKNDNFVVINSAREALHKELEKDLERVYFNANKGFFIIGFVFSMILILIIIDIADVTKASRFDLILIAIICAGLVLMNKIFHYLLKAPTLKGRRVMDQIEGFKNYLSEENSYLKSAESPKGDAISRGIYMPYILAFDLEHKWDKFSQILEKAGQPLQTYQGYHCYHFSLSFNNALISSSAPFGGGRSGGGGSSGGFGGGAGGGGGW